jgi:hypothetical protein
MARGWESKDVESQQSVLGPGPGKRLRRDVSTTDRERSNRRELLLLDRARLTNELTTARNERFRLQINAELSFIDRQLAKLSIEV